MLSNIDIQKVEALLGRAPRGLVNIPVTTSTGEPVVIQVDSLVDNKPFPTLFWLVDKALNLAIDQLEAGGLIAQLQQEIDESPELQAALKTDHQTHIQLRNQLMSPSTRQKIEQLGYRDVLDSRGIGGIANFQRIRCLHTWYAAHLVTANTIGKLLDEHLHLR